MVGIVSVQNLINSMALLAEQRRIERQELFEAFLSVCEWVHVYFTWRPNLPDEADNHIVELAIAGGATMIVTNNVRHLNRGELRFPGLRVVTPRDFLEGLR